ncbi:DNA-directed RNA polymerase III subunit C31 [Microsporum audouinii]
MSRATRNKKAPGAEFAWKSEGGGEVDTSPTPLFPKYTLPVPAKFTESEVSGVQLYRQLREKIHDGPFYTVLSTQPSYGKKGVSARAQFDPFQGMASYGQRYMRKSRTLPKLSAIPFEMNFFPKELWSTLDPKYVGLPGAFANGAGSFSKATQKRGFEEDEEEDEEDESRRKKRNQGDEDDDGSDLGDKRRGNAREGEEAPDDDDDEGEDEIVDDDFEEDEEEMGGDYNAEQYFDGGEELGDGFDEGGGGEDNDVY